MIMVKVAGPNLAMVAKMNSCPTAEVTDSTNTWKAKTGCRTMKLRANENVPVVYEGW